VQGDWGVKTLGGVPGSPCGEDVPGSLCSAGPLCKIIIFFLQHEGIHYLQECTEMYLVSLFDDSWRAKARFGDLEKLSMYHQNCTRYVP